MESPAMWVRAWLLLLVLATGCGLASAATVENLYITTVVVTERSDAARERAFAQALADVAVRVSGSRAAGARVSTVAGGAKRYVQRFGYLAENQLQVGFDPRSIDDLLAKADLPIWGRERPLTLVYLQIDDGMGGRRSITAATPGPERDAVQGAAHLRGLPLSWTTSSTLAALLDSGAPAADLDAERERLGAEALLIGRATRQPGQDTLVRWQFVFDGQAQSTTGSLDSGVHLAADRLAEAFAAASGSIADVMVEIDGIENLDAYAQTLNYLESLTLVQSVGVTEMRGSTVLFRVVSRGDVDNLRRALALNARLVPQSLEQSAPDPQRLRLRWQAAR